MLHNKAFIGVLVGLIGCTSLVHADLRDLSIDELMQIEVTSVSRKPESLADAASAIFVITADDIRRAGARSVPEALRLAPGLHVARIDATKWAITARGFNDRSANKLLVLMDGRHLYTPYFSGTFWDEQHLPMDEIERIEVIRGPGATLWGANAVNGIINIITRSARDSRGWMMQATAGSEDVASFTARYGAAMASGWDYRASFEAVEEDATESALLGDRYDAYGHARLGLRLEGTVAGDHRLHIDSAYYRSDSEETVLTFADTPGPLSLTQRGGDNESRGGWFVLGWEHTGRSGTEWSATAYVDDSVREWQLFELEQTSYSFQFQALHTLGERHDLVWGAGWRSADLPFESRSLNFTELDDDAEYQIWQIFLQDEYQLTDSLSVIFGSKFENSSYTDTLVQPSARFSWQVTEDATMWGSVSRAMRTPSRGERTLRVIPSLVVPPLTPTNPTPLPVTAALNGSSDVDSEEVIAYELGYRHSIGDFLEIDVAAYLNRYDDLLDATPGPQTCEPSGIDVAVNPLCLFSSSYLLSHRDINNGASGETRGVEVLTRWQLTHGWQVNASVSWYDMDYDTDVSASGTGEPEYTGYVQSHWQLGPNFEVSATLRAVDDVDRFDIDGYLTADLRLSWRPKSDISIELIGHNLLDDGHQEFGSNLLEAIPTEINRTVFARVTWAP